jgi:oxygen-independent coproporphyrinogen-3 oxidase
MEWSAGDIRPETIFFGGGTPSLLSLKQWERVLGAMDRLGLSAAREWTVECNPATVSIDKARLLKSAGVNRISMGVQSLNEQLLERLGRVHTREMVFKSFEILRRAGFTNINLDLMFGIPGQTLAIWSDTLAEIFSFNSEHLSSYEVIYEEDTALYEQMLAGEFEVDEDLVCAMYDKLMESAIGAGFEQYEVANFARGGALRDCKGEASSPDADPCVPSLACRHNVNYWRGGSFYGLGPSATSYVRGARTKNIANTKRYCERIENGQKAADSTEALPPLARAGETAAFGLRMTAGWPFERFRQVTGHDLRQGWASEMDQLAGRGWGERKADRFQLTPRGLRFADAAAQLFLR